MFELTDDQKAASKSFNEFIESPKETYMVIQGAAGAGKSTLIRFLLHSMDTQYKLKELLLPGSAKKVFVTTALTATTNKAVAVLEELLGEEGSTIHSLLYLTVRPDFKGGHKLVRRNGFQIIRDTLIIIDEASFISDELFKMIDASIDNCKVLLIGDQYQLAPVKQKEAIMQTLDCRKVYMNKIMRNSGIIMQTGAQFRDTVETEVFKPIVTDSENLIHVDGPTFQSMIDSAFTADDYNVNSAKILAWTNQRVHRYNNHVRSVLGYPAELTVDETVITNKPIMFSGFHKAADTYVIITDIGSETEQRGVKGRMLELNNRVYMFMPNNQMDVKVLLKDLAKKARKDGTLWTDFYQIQENWLDLRPVYASTVHKSQGSTYKQVFIDLTDIGQCNIATDVARMLYVAISRASTQVVLRGELPEKYRG